MVAVETVRHSDYTATGHVVQYRVPQGMVIRTLGDGNTYRTLTSLIHLS